MGPAHSLDDLLEDPHLREREILHEEVHPRAGPFSSVGWPAPVQGQPFEVWRPAPALGEHTHEVLAELGCSGERIAELRAQGVV
jgi:formyl-CoA transferase